MERHGNPDPAAVSGPEQAAVDGLLDELAVSPHSNLIGVLQEVQERFGYLPATALAGIARRAKLALSRVYGVVTFYADFHLTPQGKHKVRVCRGTACHVRGGNKVLEAVRAELGVEDGETTEDMMFTFQTVACLGACALAPVVVIDSTYHGMMGPGKVADVIRQYREGAC